MQTCIETQVLTDASPGANVEKETFRKLWNLTCQAYLHQGSLDAVMSTSHELKATSEPKLEPAAWYRCLCVSHFLRGFHFLAPNRIDMTLIWHSAMLHPFSWIMFHDFWNSRWRTCAFFETLVILWAGKWMLDDRPEEAHAHSSKCEIICSARFSG